MQLALPENAIHILVVFRNRYRADEHLGILGIWVQEAQDMWQTEMSRLKAKMSDTCT